MTRKKLDNPEIEYFNSGNIFTGSDRGFNYKIYPNSEGMRIIIWYGKFFCDKSEIVAEENILRRTAAEGEELSPEEQEQAKVECYEKMLAWVEEQREIYYDKIEGAGK